MARTFLSLCSCVALLMATQSAPAQDSGSTAGSGDAMTMESSRTETTTTTSTVKGLKIVSKEWDVKIPYLTLETTDIEATTGYRGVDDFFNIREANPNVGAGQWQLEVGSAWSTYRAGQRLDDDINIGSSIKYGITDDVNVELGILPLNLGDGNNIDGHGDAVVGNGELNFKAFWRFMQEQDLAPAMALWGEMRIPSGCNSSNVDGTFYLTMTKTVAKNCRAHVQGFIKTANGARGDFDRRSIGDRRDFQWGVGPGFDYMIDQNNILVFNYLNKAGEYYGHQNNNLLELGWVHHLAENQQLMLAAQGEIHSDAAGPHWTGKVQYSIAW